VEPLICGEKGAWEMENAECKMVKGSREALPLLLCRKDIADSWLTGPVLSRCDFIALSS